MKILMLTFFVVTGYSNACPDRCVCISVAKRTHCDSQGYERIPEGIPSDTQQLQLGGNHFITGTLQKKNFSSTPNLQTLYLSHCGIEMIEPGTFEDLSALRFLDLSKNSLKVLGPQVFRGLALEHLFLQRNPHVRLDPNVFQGMTTVGLYLSECYFHHINPQIFKPLQNTLEILRMDKNRLKSIPRELLPLFRQMRHIRLGENPFICNCDLQWLKDFFDETQVFKDTVLPSCGSPEPLAGKTFSSIDSKEMLCTFPELQEMEVFFDGENVTIRCEATSDPAPSLSWKTPDGNLYTESPKVGTHVTQGNLVVSQHSLASRGIYRCIASNPAGNSSLSLTLDWPAAPKTTPTSSTSKFSTTSRFMKEPCTVPTVPMIETQPEKKTKEDIACPGVNQGRRFTLLELLGAAAGAFCFAVIISIFCLICAYRRLSSRGAEESKTQRFSASPSSSGKENLYSMLSPEERERFTQEEKDRLYTAGHLREFTVPPPTSSFRHPGLEMDSTFRHPEDVPLAHPLHNGQEFPTYGHLQPINVGTPRVPTSVVS